jgi:hypothetical protein
MARTLKTGGELPKRFIYCIGEDGCPRAFGNADSDQPEGDLAWRKMCLAEWLAQLLVIYIYIHIYICTYVIFFIA